MKKYRILFFTLLFAVIISFCTASVGATGFTDESGEIVSEPENVEVVESESYDDTQSEYIESSAIEEIPTEPEYVEIETQPQQDESDYEDTSSQYEQAQTSSDTESRPLPTLDTSSVQKPTAVGSGVKKAETGMVAGVISWLCVAVGVAVICGVLVSSRTSRGSSNRRK